MSDSEISSSEHDQRVFLEATYLLAITAISIFTAHFLEKFHIHFIPESGAIIIVGVFFGFIGWLAGINELEAANSFNVDVFQLVLLPAIIFESGFSLKKKGMFRNFRPILLFAIIGTAISTVIVASAIIYLLTPNGIGHLTSLEALMFGALISATDPVATLAIFSSVFRLDEQFDSDDAPVLYSVVFGESVLNDAVAIVLFTTFEGFSDNIDLQGEVIGQIIAKFLYVAICSVLIGIFFGLLSALLTKWTLIRQNPKFDLVILYLCAWMSYSFASAFELSGLFAIFFCGLIEGHYTWYNLSAFSQLSSPIVFKSIANLSETVVFAFLGMGVFGAKEVQADFSLVFVSSAFAAIVIARIVQVFPLSWISNIGRKRKITFREQVAIAYSGLRGSLAFALALKTDSLGLPHSSLIISSTLSIAMFTTLFQGATTRPLLKCLKISEPQFENHSSLTVPSKEQLGANLMPGGSVNSESDIERGSVNGSVNGGGSGGVTSSVAIRPTKGTWWGMLDVKYFKKIFVSNPSIAGGGTKALFAELARGLTQLTYRKKLDTHKQILYDLLLRFSAVHSVPSHTYNLHHPKPRTTNRTFSTDPPLPDSKAEGRDVRKHSTYKRTVMVEIPVDDEVDGDNAFDAVPGSPMDDPTLSPSKMPPYRTQSSRTSSPVPPHSFEDMR